MRKKNKETYTCSTQNFQNLLKKKVRNNKAKIKLVLNKQAL